MIDNVPSCHVRLHAMAGKFDRKVKIFGS